MSEFINNLASYSIPDINEDITVDLGIDDPILNADLTNPSSYDYIFKTNNFAINNSLNDLLTTAKKIKKTVFPTVVPKSVDNELSFPDLLKQEGINAKITSGYRPNSVTNTGKKSNHSIKGGAYDIVPTNGKTFEDLRREIYSNKRIRDWMNKRGWGIIEEVNDADQKKYGATGANWHFGPDSAGIKNWRQNLIRYGENGFKFDSVLASTKNDKIPELDLNTILMYKELLTNKSIDIDSYFPYITSSKKSTPFPIIKEKEQEQSNENYSTENNNTFTGNIPNLIHSKIKDKDKADILTNIAYNESSFRVNASNPTSSASGLFGFIDSTKRTFGYGNDAESQIDGASKYYDYLSNQVQPYINKYGKRGLSKGQIIYGMWFRPQSMINYLKYGKDNYVDAQGTQLNNILNKIG